MSGVRWVRTFAKVIDIAKHVEYTGPERASWELGKRCI
jgi:hypothetical protein